MSGKNYELSLVMRLRDMASRGLNLAARDMQSGIARTQQATNNLTRAVTDYSKKREAAAILGIRSEKDIQREIQRTEAAYNRLANSGTLSMREQARAADALKHKLRELNNEMGKHSLAQRGAGMAAGAAAAGYVLAKPVEQTMDYGMRLAGMANTAFNDRDTAGRIAGKRELNDAIVAAVRQGGGTRESAASALDTLIASGAMSAKDSMAMLPSLVKASTASGAEAGELAQIGIRGMQTMGVKASEMPRILDMAITAGQAGGFELKDMAKWLPQQMAAAKLSGLSGTAGVAKLLAANQASAITAGTKDEAGNNLVNLLAKINSQDTANDAKKLGINLSGTLAAARGKGIDSLDAFVGIVDHVVGKNKNYQALQEKLKTAKGDDKRAILESQADILQGSSIGQLVQDRQAMMALVAIMGNRGYMADVQKKALNGAGATDANFAVISQEAGFKVQQAENEKTFATTAAFEKLTPLVGGAADGFTTIAREFPLLTAATVAATTALTALAAAAGAAALANGVTGGKGGLIEGVLSKGKALAAGAGAWATRVAAPLLADAGTAAAGGATGMAGGVLASGAAGYMGMSALMESKGGQNFLEQFTTDLARIFAAMGNETAQHVVLHIDGREVATVINRHNARDAARH